MNYFAHGIRFLDHPWFLAGTALPDLLSLVDRRVRLRPNRLTPLADGSGTPDAELAAGALQHMEDDHWFHKTRTFAECCAIVGRMFRDFLGPGDGFRCGFLGHVTSELLLDALLIERFPQRIEEYYAAFAEVEGKRLAAAVSALAGQSIELEPWLDRFCRDQFLRDYADDARLAYRLNQVLRRIKLEPLPPGIEVVVGMSRAVIETSVEGLLPAAHFRFPDCSKVDVT